MKGGMDERSGASPRVAVRGWAPQPPVLVLAPVLSIALIVFGAMPLLAGATTAGPVLHWAVSAGGSNYDVGHDVAVDVEGNAVVTGNFVGQATFGRGARRVTLTSAGRRDVFVARYTPEGLVDWAVSAGGDAADTFGWGWRWTPTATPS